MSQTSKKKKKRQNDPLLIFACVLGIVVIIAIGIILRSMNRSTVIDDPGWHMTSGEKIFYIDAITKKRATGLNMINNSAYFFQPDGYVKGGWAEYEGEKIFVNNDGRVVTGEIEIDGALYSFAFDTFKMLRDSFVELSDGKAYYFGSDGKAVKRKICDVNGEQRYFDETGYLVKSGWITLSEGEYYADSEGVLVSGKVSIDGEDHFFGPDHKALTGKHTINNVEYNFDSRGYDNSQSKVTTTPAVTTVPSVTTSGPSVTTTAPASGTSVSVSVSKPAVTTAHDVTPKDGWREVNGKKQYIYANGSAAKGAVKIDDAIYVFAPSGDLCGAGWNEINGSRYYLDDKGIAKTGFAEIDNKSYYFDSMGRMLKGTQSINGAYYYIEDSGEIVKNRFIEMNGFTYYYDESGQRAVGFRDINGYKYYFSETKSKEGQMQYGYIKVREDEIYMDSEGRQVTGWVTMGNCQYYFNPKIVKNAELLIDGVKCVFDENGVLLDANGDPA